MREPGADHELECEITCNYMQYCCPREMLNAMDGRTGKELEVEID